ncbi:hypothetical protein ADL28_08415 [Streptomyces violaceusniger]|uniref:Integrase n=2 Tax=Streptomyces violaceusniger group TaxID=2839105 RepID=A0ABD5JFI1_9ACTN|nr:hypothetical protein [Streptomyces violaceusniger]KUL65091.1 hypothetical protein ADL28_08415 [Streptomyces violaceusniger]MEE4585984.1 hypothetical protein [Streptomyces sp. DSM 41602]
MSVAGEAVGKMMYPLVREPTATGAPYRVPVAVTYRVLGLARRPYYRWLDRPVTDAERLDAWSRRWARETDTATRYDTTAASHDTTTAAHDTTAASNEAAVSLASRLLWARSV